MQPQRRIVVIEDDAVIAAAVAERLRTEGFAVELAADGAIGVDLVERQRPDLVVLDLNLPGIDGLEVCRRIQRHGHVPVLMLTARDDETDLLIGLAVGADDYVTKPFSPRELVARIRAVLRRVELAGGASGDEPVVRSLAGGVRVDEQRRRVWADEREVALTATEFDLLIALLEPAGAVKTRERLLSEVWGYRDGSGARTVDSHVRALDRKSVV